MPPLVAPVPYDWSRHSLEQIWSMIGRQVPATGQSAANLWSSVQTLCHDTAMRLEQALAKLREHWPPTQESARMFQQWGASLVAALHCTAETARLNLNVVRNIQEELSTARARVSALMAKRDEYQALDQAREPNAMPWITPLDWRPELERQAREVMADLEQKVYTYALDLHADPPYQPVRRSGDSPYQPIDGDADDSARLDHPGSVGASFPWPQPSWTPLSGQPSTDGNPGWTDPTSPSGPSGPGTVLGGGVIAPVPGSPSGPGDAVVGPGGAFVDTPGGRVLGPGGIIGAPMTAPAAPGRSGTPGPPAGLAIGPKGVGGAPAGTGMVPLVPPLMGQPAARDAPNPAGPRRGRRSGLPNVFEVPAAQPEVIRPPAEPRHDPGPGVIGIDR
jgi:hypothetical protein